MILPSDEDSRKPRDTDPPGKDPDDALPWSDDDDDPPGFFDDDGEDAPVDATNQVQAPAPPGWREDLKEDLDDAIAELKEIEDPAEEFDPPEPPDLFTFYGELVALRNEMRRASRKATEVFQQMGAGKLKPEVSAAGKSLAEALVHHFDVLQAAEKGLLPPLAPVMKLAGLQRVKTKGADFDPATMTTPQKAGAGAKVAHELVSGWIWNGTLLRPAEVTIA